MDRHLLKMEKPCRYIGGETGSAVPVEGDLRFVLAFPDTYEVGMSHLGLQILYGILKETPGVTPYRAYAPWPDREHMLRGEEKPLATAEGNLPLADADILGFSLQYELSYTNILAMLDLAGIPLLARERGNRYPLVIGGGPCACNPEPLADFFDLFLIGDGEEAVPEIAAACRRWKGSGGSREQLLASLEEIEGVYVPSFFEPSYDRDGRIAAIARVAGRRAPVRRRLLADLEGAPYPVTPVVPFMKTIHDRVSVEISRGCTRGCRFCQAGYIYRPVRDRSPERILDLVEKTLENTGYDEVSLLSLSTGDYGCILPLLRSLMSRYHRRKVAVSFPSLRVGTISEDLTSEIRKVRKTGFTLAPEAGTDRLRKAINKGITEEDLLADAAALFGAGWRMVKLYFMIGLPGETREDVEGIADLARKVKNEARPFGGGEVNVSVSTFVPKAHTPFQWEPQMSMEATREAHAFLRQELKRRKLPFKWHDPAVSFLEGVFARGDRRLGKVLVRAMQGGCRFDGWSERLSFDRWMDAFAVEGMDPAFYHRRRALSEPLPWDHLDSGTPKDFLRRELEKSEALLYTPDCRYGSCAGCGVCDFRRIMPRALPEASCPLPEEGAGEGQAAEAPPTRIRLKFSKVGLMSMVSHLELITLFTRAVRRAGLPIRYSQGFHPHPRFSFATALSVGVESHAEYLDIDLAQEVSPGEVVAALNRVLPEGIRALEGWAIPRNAPSLSVIMERVRYRVTFPEFPAQDLRRQVEEFLRLESFPCRRQKKGKVTEIDLRREVAELLPLPQGLEMVLGRGRPLDVAAAVTSLSEQALEGSRIEKLEVRFRKADDGWEDASSPGST